jgi:hypothetical protein
MPSAADEVEAQLHDLETRIDRLKILYEQYFIGLEKAEPTVPRKEIVRIFAALQQMQIRNTALRFRYTSLTQRWNTYTTRWGKTLREIELGTYDRLVARAQRRGIALPPELAKGKLAAGGEAAVTAVEDVQGFLDEGDLSEMLSEIDEGDRPYVFEGSDPLGLGEAHAGIGQIRERSITPPPSAPEPLRRQSITPPPMPVVEEPDLRGESPRRERSITPPPIAVAPVPKGPKPHELPRVLPPVPPPPRPPAPPAIPGPPSTDLRGESPRRERSITPPPIAVGPVPRGPKPLESQGIRPVPPPPRPPAAPPPSPIPGMSEAELRALHRRYVDARKTSGAGEVRYEALVATLQKQVPDLLSKHKVTKVSFEVATKDGRVILKAMPKKDG